MQCSPVPPGCLGQLPRVATGQHGAASALPSGDTIGPKTGLAGNGPSGAILRHDSFGGCHHMNVLILVLILLLFVTGAVGLVLGRKGINTKTLIGAWLVLLSSLGFIYLAGRVAERERAWRTKIRDLENKIATEVGGPLAGKKVFLGDSADDLSPAEKSWQEDAIKLLQQAGGTPAKELREGRVDLAVEDAEGEPPPKAAEWDIGVLSRDDFIAQAKQTLDELGRIVRLKQREQIATETWRNRYWTSSLFKPPSETSDDAIIELDVSGDTEQPLNAGAELAIFAFELGDQFGFLGVFAVENVKPVEDKTLQLAIKPLTTPDKRDRDAWRLAKNESEFLVFEDLPTDRWAATIKPNDGKPAEEEVPLEQALAAIAGGQSLPGEYWATVTVENAAAFENVNEGTSLDLDLQTAQQLQQDGAVNIDRVVRRRLLLDPLTALRGTRFAKVDVPTAGIEGIRGKLSAELNSLSLMTNRIDTAMQATTRENETKKQTLAALGNDKKAWEEDIAFASRALDKLEERVEKTGADLADARREVAQKRIELRELTAQIMGKSSLPRERSATGGPAARRAALP